MAETCQTCQKSSSPEVQLLICAKCLETTYCSRECQKKDWSTHKKTICKKDWWDDEIIRGCDDGNLHEGRLELVTWEGLWHGEKMGWGAVLKEESADMKARFEGEMNKDEKTLYEEWPQAFRWTCCGNAGDNTFGCDHHGKGKKPCTCDFCKMGKPLTEKIFGDMKKSIHAQGLDIKRGPDRRSYDRDSKQMNEMMREIMGMDG